MTCELRAVQPELRLSLLCKRLVIKRVHASCGIEILRLQMGNKAAILQAMRQAQGCSHGEQGLAAGPRAVVAMLITILAMMLGQSQSQIHHPPHQSCGQELNQAQLTSRPQPKSIS